MAMILSELQVGTEMSIESVECTSPTKRSVFVPTSFKVVISVNK